MNSGWSIYIIVLTIANILACLWLLWWTARKRVGDRADSDTTGHVWDEDITELNRPMPRWWLNLFYLTVAFGFVYLAIFPGLGAFAGSSGWTSGKEHDADVAKADAALRPLFARFAGRELAELAHDPEALKLGRSIFANNCAMCHGSDARGAIGFPNLTDNDWLWGDTPETVVTTILEGRQAVMPPWGPMLGDKGVTEVATYVQSLSGAAVDPALAAAGERSFKTICVACHGPDGKGNPLLGAPNLTDNIWLYGGNFEAIAKTVREGRIGKMPAHRELLGEDKARLAAAFVLAQKKG